MRLFCLLFFFFNNLHICFDGSVTEGGAYGMKLGGPDGAFPPYGDGFGVCLHHLNIT